MTPQPSAPTFEHHAPRRLGTGESRPRLSWQVAGAAPSYRQHAAELRIVITSPDGTTATDVHRHDGEDQILIDWPARALRSREAVSAQVRVFDGVEWSPWSDPGSIEVGLLEASDWVASFVGPADPASPDPAPPGRLRSEFELPTTPMRARLYVTAHGMAQVELNGRRVGDEELTPGWTSYGHRLRYATFDVTGLVKEGPNAIGVWLGEGWWRGRLGFGGGRTNVYGDHLAALVQLEVTTMEGERIVVASDDTWQAGPGPILKSSLYDGEHFDARLHDPAWSCPNRQLDGWSPVALRPNAATLVAPTGPPVRCTDELAPATITDKGAGRWIVDFGQNHSGRVRMTVPATPGREIRIRHAEILQAGELCIEPLRTAEATDVLVTGEMDGWWEPRFSIHGYRYVEISGWPGTLRPSDVVSRVIHTDLARRGWFHSSNALVDKLHENVVWSVRSNFVDIPTDCPQRDERLGWTGDLQVFAPSAAFLYDVTGMLSSWLQDLAAEQDELDWVPPYVPYISLEPFASLPREPMAAWGDVAVLTPDVLHTATADDALLRRQVTSAVQWMQHVESAAGPGRICHDTEQFGDWLDPAAPPDNPFEATTDRYLVATAYFAHSARRLAAIGALLGEAEITSRFERLADEVRDAYAATYMQPNGHLTSDSQTAYALTTVFDLWPDEESKTAGTARLAELVRASGGAIATGFVGTPVVCDALTLGGYLAEAYQLLEHTECPSWLYPVLMGATTTWERWDSLTPDGLVNTGTMTSFNHYALGAVVDWLHRVVAGLEPDAPGYRHIRFAPRPGGTLTEAGARHITPYGEASIDWKLEDNRLSVHVSVPVGASATVELPNAEPVEIRHGDYEFTTSTVITSDTLA